MCNPARMIAYQDSWSQVKLAYYGGFMVSERGFQAVLHRALQANLPRGVHVVVEPTWKMADGTQRTPDLAIIEGGGITDIFELKFVPQGNAIWEDDIDILHAYVVGDPQYSVRLNPQTGQWAAPLPVRAGCCLHFAVISQYGAQAVWPPLPGNNGINHWFGRVGGAGGWDIHWGHGH